MIFGRTPSVPDHDAFKREALSHTNALYAAALSMTRNAHDAEDLVQETYLKAFRFWSHYQRDTNCKAWLFRILTNTYINRSRKTQRVVGVLDPADLETTTSAWDDAGTASETPETVFVDRLFPEHVRSAIEALPEAFRIPVILADLHDFSYKEIAEIMDCPVGTVMSRLFRGRKRLQEQLFAYAVELGIIEPREARGEDGAISLEAYRNRRKAAGEG